MTIMAKVYEAALSIYMGAQCWPMNDLLTKPITPAFDLLSGGVGGFVAKIGVVAVMIGIATVAVFKILRQRDAKEEVGKLVWVTLILPVVVIAIMVFTTVFNAINNMC